MDDSEEEDKQVIEEIEGAQKKVIEVERTENKALQRRMTKMGEQLEAIKSSQSVPAHERAKSRGASRGGKKSSQDSAAPGEKAFDLPTFDVEVETASLDDLKKMISEA